MPNATSTPDRRLRVAVIGCGPIGNLHAEAISKSPHARLVAVCDVDDRRVRSTAERFSVPAFADFNQMIDGEKLDVVSIATPDHLHVEPALAAARAGCHLFCEKPLAGNVAEAQVLVEAASASGVQLAVDYNRRFAFGYRTARQLLDEGAIGAPQYCQIRVIDPTPSRTVVRHKHVMFTTLLTHHFDLARFYFGEIDSLYAEAGEDGNDNLMRSVTLTLKFASGAVGAITAAYRSRQTRTSEWLELGGSLGTIVVEDVTRRVTAWQGDPAEQESFEPDWLRGEGDFYHSLGEHLRAFLTNLADGRQPPVTGHDGLVGMRLAAAAIQSLASGRPIEVESFA